MFLLVKQGKINGLVLYPFGPFLPLATSYFAPFVGCLFFGCPALVLLAWTSRQTLSLSLSLGDKHHRLFISVVWHKGTTNRTEKRY